MAEGALVQLAGGGSDTSGITGYFLIDDVESGPWDVTISKEGFHTINDSIDLEPEQHLTRTYQMAPESEKPDLFNLKSPRGNVFVNGTPATVELEVDVKWNGTPGEVIFEIGPDKFEGELEEIEEGETSIARAKLEIPLPDLQNPCDMLKIEATNGEDESRKVTYKTITFSQEPTLLTWWYPDRSWQFKQEGFYPTFGWDFDENDAKKELWKIEKGVVKKFKSEGALGAAGELKFDPISGKVTGALTGKGFGSMSIEPVFSGLEILGEAQIGVTGKVEVFLSRCNIVTKPSMEFFALGKAGVGAPAILVVDVLFPPAAPAVHALVDAPIVGRVVRALKLRVYFIMGGAVKGGWTFNGLTNMGNGWLGMSDYTMTLTFGLEGEVFVQPTSSAYAKMYAGGTGSPEWDWMKDPSEFKSLTLKAYVGYEYKAPLFSVKKNEWALLVKFDGKLPGGKPLMVPIVEDEGWQPSKATFLAFGPGHELSDSAKKKTGEKLDLLQTDGGAEEVVVQNVYELAAPSIVASSPRVEVVFSKYDENKPWYGASDISMVRLGSSGSWFPRIVTNDGKAEYGPTSANGVNPAVIYSAWSRVEGDVSAAEEPADVFPNVEIVAARYSRNTTLWNDPVQITSNSLLDRDPVVGAYGGAVGVFWVQNEAAQYYGDAAYGDRLMYSTWNGSGWTAGQQLWTGKKAIIEMDFVESADGEGHLVFSVDEDGDIATIDDQELYAMSTSGGAWGSAGRLTNDAKMDSSPALAALDGVATVVWSSSGELRYSSLAAFSSAPVFTDWTPETEVLSVVGQTVDSGMAIAYTLQTGEGTDIFAALYQSASGLWSKPRQLTSDAKAERGLSIASINDEIILSYLKTEINRVSKDVEIEGETYTIENIPENGQTDLCVLRHQIGEDLAIQPDSLQLSSGNPLPGEIVTVSAVVENKGEEVEENIPVTFYDGNPSGSGIVIGDPLTVTGPLVGGATEMVSTNWTVPQDALSHEVFVVVGALNKTADTSGDRNTANNIASTLTATPDIAVQHFYADKVGPSDFALTASITNQGSTPTGPFNLAFRIDSTTGSVLHSETIAELNPGIIEDYSYFWDGGASGEDYEEIFVVLDGPDDVYEADEENNSSSAIATLQDVVQQDTATPTPTQEIVLPTSTPTPTQTPTPHFVTTIESAPMLEGQDADIYFHLSSAPADEVSTIVEKVSGDDGFSITYGETYTIPAAEFDTWRKVTIASANDEETVDKTATYQVRETSTNGFPSKQFTVTMYDDDDLYLVSGTISESTTWSQTDKPYYINGTIDIPAGVTLTISPGVEVLQFGNRKAFSVSGNLVANDATFRMDTEAQWQDGGDDCFDVADGGSVTFTGCSFYTRERNSRSTWWPMDYRAACIDVKEGASATVNGCSFFSTNTIEGYRTMMAIAIHPDSTVSIGKDGATSCSFEGFRFGLFWYQGGANQPTIDADCTFADSSEADMAISGTVVSTAALPPFSIKILGELVISNGGTLSLIDETNIYNTDKNHRIKVQDGGTLQADGATYTFYTEAQYFSNSQYPGIYIENGGTVTLEQCTLYSKETSYRSDYGLFDYQSAAILALGESTVTVSGCHFESLLHDQNEYKTMFGLLIANETTAVVQAANTGQGQMPCSFTRFKSGIGWNMGNGSLTVGDSTLFSSVPYEISTPGGDIATSLNLPKHDVYFLGVSTVKTGATLTVPQNAYLLLINEDAHLTVENGASLIFNNAKYYTHLSRTSVSGNVQATDTIIRHFTEYDYNADHRMNGFELKNGATATFTSCSFFLQEDERSGDTNYWSTAISAQDGSSLTVDDCFFTNDPIANSNPWYSYSTYSIRSFTTTKLHIKNSRFTDNYIALRLDAFAADMDISGNDFHGNVAAAVQYAGSGLDLQGNWWGDASGPTHQSNPLGQGDYISGTAPVYSGPLLAQPEDFIQFYNPLTRQKVNQITDDADQSDVELFGFRVLPNQSNLDRVAFRLYDRAGMDNWDKVSNFRLAMDNNSNGTINAGESKSVAGEATTWTDRNDLMVVFEDQSLTTPTGTAGYILLADLTGLEGGEGFSVRLEDGACRTAPSVGLENFSTPARHRSGEKVFLSETSAGQEADNLNNDIRQSDVELFSFHLEGQTQRVEKLEFSLSNLLSIYKNNFIEVRLYEDTNGNGTVDAGDTLISNESSISTSGTTGTITITKSFDISSDYILVADMDNLNGGAKLTVDLTKDKVTLNNTSVTIDGVIPVANHTVDAPYSLALSPDWLQPEDLGDSATLSGFNLVGLRLQPVGEQVDSLQVQLSNLYGISAGDLTNARVYWDKDLSGDVNGGDEVMVSSGTVSVQNSTGTITFNSSFNIPGDLIIVLDIANLQNEDELTVSMGGSDVGVPNDAVVTGQVAPIRYTFNTSLFEYSNNKTKWTLVYRSPGGTVVSGRYNHGGDKVILGYDTGSAWIYDAQSNTPLLMLKDHYDKVMYAGFNSDDTAAVTVSKDGAVYIWDQESGALRNSMFSDLFVDYAVPSPDFTKLMVITEGKGILLDIDSQTKLWEFIPGDSDVTSIAYSPDGTRVLIGSSDTYIYMLDAETGLTLDDNSAHGQAVTGVGFAGDGNRVMSVSPDNTVQIYNADNLVEILSSVTLGESESAKGAAVSNDGSRVAVVTNQTGSAQLHVYDSTVNPFLELFAINLSNVAGQYWRGYLESVTFNDDSDEILVCSSGYGWASAASFRADNGSFIRNYGPRGQFSSDLDRRPRIAQDGERIFYQTNSGMNLLRQTEGKPILYSPNLTDSRDFDISDDGTLVSWVDSERDLRIDVVSDSGFTKYLDRDVNFDAISPPPSFAPSGRKIIGGDWLFNALNGDRLANYAANDGNYRSAFSPDETFWGYANESEDAVYTIRTDDPNATLYYKVTTGGELGVNPRKLFFHPDNKRLGVLDQTHSQNRGVWMFNFDRDDRENRGDPVGIYRFWDNNDAALSKDGTMLLIGGEERVMLFDVRTGNVLRYFYPQHSSLRDMRAYSVQFAKNDTLIMIAWNYNYVELYRRSKAVELALTPSSRTLDNGQSQGFRVEAIYDDTTRLDVTPIEGDTDEKAILSVEPASAGSFQGNVLTVSPSAAGTFKVVARYRENANNLMAEATITVGQSVLTELRPEPGKMAVTPGVFKPIRYYATYDDGYETEVTDDITLSSDRPDDVNLVGQSVKVKLTAIPGDITVTGAYNDGTTQITANTIVTMFGPKTEWERYRLTAGGYGYSGDFNYYGGSPSADTTRLAVGASSGALNIYKWGVTPSQYAIEKVIPAHAGEIHLTDYLDDGRIVTASEDGALKVWDLWVTSATPAQTYRHDAPILSAYTDGSTRVAFGDSQGKVGVYNISSDSIEWVTTVHNGKVNAVAINSDTVLSGGEDMAMYSHRISDATELNRKEIHSGPIIAVGFMSGGKVFSVGSDSAAFILNQETFTTLEDYFFPAVPTRAEFINNQLYISTDNPVATWIYNTDGLLTSWLPHTPSEGKVTKLLVDPTQNYVITGRGTHKKTVEVEFMGYDIGEEEVTSPFSSWQFWEKGRSIYRGSLAHSYPLTDAHISGDAKTIFTQSSKRTMQWVFDDVENVTGKQLMETGYFVNKNFAGMDFTLDDRLMATRVDASIYMFDNLTNLLYKTLHLPGGGPFALSPQMPPATSYIATVDRKTRIWDLANLSLIDEDELVCSSVDFRGTEHLLGSTYDLKKFFMWTSSDLLRVTSTSTTYSPSNIFVNQLGTRAALITEYVEEDMFSKTIFYYLEVYNIEDIETGDITPVGGPLFLLSIEIDKFGGGGGEESVQFSVAVSEDTSMALVGASGDRPVKLLNVGGDGSTIREFESNTAGTDANLGAGAVGFTNEDRDVWIAWQEGYTEVYRRVQPTELDVLFEQLSSSKPGSKAVVSRKVLQSDDTLYVKAGQQYQTETVANYENGSQLNVTSTALLETGDETLVQPDDETPRQFKIADGAQDGQSTTLTIRYDELGSQLETVINVIVGDKPKTPGDVDGNGVLDYMDIFEFSTWWHESGVGTNNPADITNDTDVDEADLLNHISGWK